MCVHTHIQTGICASIYTHPYDICICASTSAPPNFQLPLPRGERPPRSHRGLRAGGRHCSSPVCPVRPGDGRDSSRRAPAGSGGTTPACGGGGAGGGKPGPVPHLLRRAGAPSGDPGGAGAGPGEARRERLSGVGGGSRCPAAVGAARELRRRRRRGGAAESGGDGRRERPSVPAGVLRAAPPPFALPEWANVGFCCLFLLLFSFLKTAGSARAAPLGLPPAPVISLYSPRVSASYITAFEHTST